MLRPASLKLTLLVLFLCSCSGDDEGGTNRFNTDGFDPITDTLLFQTLSPAEDYDYFEFRNAECGSEGPFQTIYGEGVKCSLSPQSDCFDQIDALRPEFAGYDTACLPGCCSEYLVAQLNGENILFDTLGELNSFLGPIDSVSDALVFVSANGYYFTRGDIAKSGIKEVIGGYEVIALRTTAFCAPIVTTQYLIFISENGTIEITAEREESREEDLCI